MKLTVLNLKETLFEGDVQSITIPAEMGELTILPNHVPLITALKHGTISALTAKSERYTTDLPATQASLLALQAGERKYIEAKGGILEFSDNEATILL